MRLRQRPASHFDQMMVLHDPRHAGTEAYIRIYNTDGSEAEACGNGMRCVGWLVAGADRPQGAQVRDHGRRARRRRWRTSTTSPSTWAARGSAGRTFRSPRRSTTRRTIELQIGPIDKPILHSPSVVNVGNPHAVFWVDDVNAYDLGRIGPMLENHPIFPERANISLAHVTSPSSITLRTWERGAGLTKACGSAACAAAVCAARKGLTGRQVTVTLPGGAAADRVARRRSHLHDRPGRGRARRRARRAGDGVGRDQAFANDASLPHWRPLPLAGEGQGGGDCRTSDAGIPPTPSPSPQGGGECTPTSSGSASSRWAAASTPTSSEVMRGHAAAAGLDDAVIVNTCAVTAEAVRQAAQTIRKLRRESPQSRIIVTGCAAQIEPERFADMPEVDARRRQRREDARRNFSRPESRRQPARARQRHHVGARDGACHDRRLRLARPRLRAGAERLRPPLHVLHHSLRSRAVALGARRRGRGPGAPPGRGGLPRDRPDRRRHDIVRPRPAGRDDAGQAGAPHPAPRAGAEAAAAVLDRPGRGGRASDGRHRRGAASDAASAPVAAVGRRHDPEAHEAPAFCAPMPSRSAGRPAASGPTSCSAPT